MSQQDRKHPEEVIPEPATIDPSRRNRRAKKAKKMVAFIDSDLCTGCEACQDFCPTGCIRTIPGEIYETIGAVNQVDETGCVGCFICLDYCRWEAILQVPDSRAAAD